MAEEKKAPRTESARTESARTESTAAPVRFNNPYFARTLYPLLSNKDNSFWTKPTQIRCWYCGHTFPNPPYPMPTSYHNGEFRTRGVYCSLTCVKSHVIEMRGHHLPQRLEDLTLMAGNVFNYHKDIPTIDKYRFASYGGDLSHEDYLRNDAIAPRPVFLRSAPFVDLPFADAPLACEQPFKDETSKTHINPVLPASIVKSLSASNSSSSAAVSTASASQAQRLATGMGTTAAGLEATRMGASSSDVDDAAAQNNKRKKSAEKKRDTTPAKANARPAAGATDKPAATAANVAPKNKKVSALLELKNLVLS